MMSKLNKTQIYAISWLNHIGKDVDFISTELGVTPKQVLSTIEKNQTSKSEDTNNVIKTASESAAKKIISKNLMINQTASKKQNHVMVMTQEASMTNDELKKNLSSAVNRNTKHIFRPNEQK